MDNVTQKIFYVVSHSDHPVTVNEIYLALRSKDITRNRIVSRLVQLNLMGKVDRGYTTRNGKLLSVYRERKEK